MNIQEEVHTALKEVEKMISEGKELSEKEISILFLTSLIEEEGK